MFFGQRHFGFGAASGGSRVARRQALAFAATQIVGLAMNAYSFPVWHRVFRAPVVAPVSSE